MTKSLKKCILMGSLGLSVDDAYADYCLLQPPGGRHYSGQSATSFLTNDCANTATGVAYKDTFSN